MRVATERLIRKSTPTATSRSLGFRRRFDTGLVRWILGYGSEYSRPFLAVECNVFVIRITAVVMRLTARMRAEIRCDHVNTSPRKRTTPARG